MRVEGKKKKSGKRKGRQKKPAVQRLFLQCREVFSLASPCVALPDQDVARIRSVLDSMNPDDLDVRPLSPYFENIRADSRVKPIAYLHVYECDSFSIGIFCLPPSAIIPLHNHPGMTVFSKLLFGSMHIKSYDWADVTQVSNNVNNGCTSHREVRLAKVKTDADFTAPCDTSILYPTSGGNMHCFTALTSCAVLDVLGPPYCDSEGRHCTYYTEHPYSHFTTTGDHHDNGVPVDDGYAWLEEMERPSDFYVLGAKYTGPQITDN